MLSQDSDEKLQRTDITRQLSKQKDQKKGKIHADDPKLTSICATEFKV